MTATLNDVRQMQELLANIYDTAGQTRDALQNNMMSDIQLLGVAINLKKYALQVNELANIDGMDAYLNTNFPSDLKADVVKISGALLQRPTRGSWKPKRTITKSFADGSKTTTAR